MSKEGRETIILITVVTTIFVRYIGQRAITVNAVIILALPQSSCSIGSKLGSPPNPSQHWQSWSLKKLKTEGALLVFFPAPCLSLTVHCSVKTAVQEPMADANDVT